MRRSGNDVQPQSGTNINIRGNFVRRTPESAIVELVATYEKWKYLPKEDRSKFNKTWLTNYNQALLVWMERNGGVEFFIKQAGGEVEKDFEKQEVIRGRTKESATEELRIAYEKWKSLSETERGEFNTEWLEVNCGTLPRWLYLHGGIESYVKFLGKEAIDDFKKRKHTKDRTPESALAELRAAYATWKALPEKERGEFGISWLQRNAAGINYWMSNNGGVLLFVKQVGGDLEKDFDKPRTSESAIDEIRAAYATWKALPEKERGKFNPRWVNQNAPALASWIRKHEGFSYYISIAGGDIEKDFEKQEMTLGRTSESALAELRAAYEVWKALPEDKKNSFNGSWLRQYSRSFLAWLENHGGLTLFVKQVGGDLEKDFGKRETMRGKRTSESALAELRAAYEVWKALPEAERGKFNKLWMSKDFSALEAWLERHGGIELFVKQVGGDLEKDFSLTRIINRRTDRTPESALAELRAAYEVWKALPEAERGKFNKLWMKKHASRLFYWMEAKGGMELFVKQAGGDIEDNFEKIEMVRGRNVESALAELRAAYEVWKALPEAERGKFNRYWLSENYSGLESWIERHGGLEFFIKKSDADLEQDFEKRRENREKEKDLLEKTKLTIQEISEGQTETAQQFRSLVRLFGSSHALDILYKFRPEFKGLPVEYVKSCLADYLGDFLAAKHNFVLKDVGAATEFLSETTFRDGLYEVLKDHCLQYYYAQKRLGTHQDGFSIINAYLDHVVEEVGGISNKFLDDIIQKVLEFYDSALRDFKKPEQFVDRLSEDRDFPDINQRVNMKELAEKKKLLIADEMGLGKSASVIMAKEQLGIGCALVVAPSNVLDTWMAYLSDDESKKGYFRKGEAPRVLKVESPKQLEGISKTDYDYILISQERMVESYTRPLADLDPDMMIVDEVHKIKSLKGVRTKEFLPIAQKMQGDNKYLALLSGTPAPNKVRDVAIILKLLYPERFSDTPDADLVRNIIYGDIVDLRSLLIPKMQMKNLEDSVEMPELKQEIISIQMSALEKDIYEVLVEEDEFTATEKLKILRQFLLNPHLLDSTPGLESCKINALQAEVDRIFATKSKAVVFVNGYIEDIIRGDMTIFDKLKLPPGVEVRKIEGVETKDKRKRNAIQKEFNEANGKKILLVVSGDTADVGVSFTGGEEVIFYNEPWTEASKRQQLARVYRPGLEHAVAVKTLIVKGTIEEGIHSYIQAKYKAVEKLLRGVPLTELEKSQLVNDEKSEDKSLEINREWAEYFFSSVEIMNKMFGAIKNIGEEMFRKFLEEYGARYAEAYRDLGSRSYQSNTNRVSGTLISEMMRKSKQDPGEVAILDVASGPEMLRRHIGDELQDSVHSLDINQAHFDNTPGNKYVGSWAKTPFEDNSFDYLNLAMSLHYSEFVPSKGKLERLEVLREMNRVLKEGGRVVISMIYSLKIKDLEKFAKFVEALGFRIVEDYSGIAESELAFRSQVLTLEKVKTVQKSAEEIMGEVGTENSAGLKMEPTKVKLKNQRKVLHAFLLNGKGKAIELNATDQRIITEEKEITTQGESMKSAHGGEIKAIPAQEIVDKKFVRIVPKNKYILFKRLSSAPGAVVIK